ncbi:MAG TPA: tRNA glutamyl-Q(34) synthetase GluQRS [Rhodanobacteraceae bacterium]|nr:tRNA glutamyl-Q(34) synthetase GluQRS [Rhodanobacteraceae bacterium]
MTRAPPPVPAYRGRFAPSPTGKLHFGSLVAALGSWLFARAAGGAWIVRIEDLDPPREVAGADADILATLAAFGMTSDEPPVHQSRRGEIYGEAFARLRREDLVYPCWCSRSDLAPFDGRHPASCIAPRDAARSPAWRLRAPERTIGFDDAIQGRVEQDLAREVGDFVVRRADGWYAYQLAVVVDDAAQRITDIVRGADLVDSTPRQILLQEHLELPRVRYAHLPLALDREGRKLSKEERALGVDAADPLPALRAALAFLGQPAAAGATVDAALASALENFDARRIPSAPRAPPAFAALRKDVS